jgi:NADH dehydrogenase
MNRILVIGSTGFVGTCLVRRLAENKIDFTCMKRRTSNVNKIKQFCSKTVYGDLTDKKSLLNALKEIDIVINLAAVTQSTNEKLNYDVNARGVTNLVNACKEMGVKKIISMSSVNAVLVQKDCYGKSKYEGQKAIENSGLDYIIFIPPLIYGSGDKGLTRTIGMVKKLPMIPIIGSGNAKMQPVYVENVCDAIISALQKSELKKKTYNIAGSQALSFESYVRAIENTFGVRKPHLHIPVFIIRPIAKIIGVVAKNSSMSIRNINTITQDKDMDISEAVADLDFKPISFEEGLRKMYGDKK